MGEDLFPVLKQDDILIFTDMCAGVIPIAHNSGGPMMDIVVRDSSGMVGYLCESKEEYADAITQVLSMDQEKRMGIAAAARRCAYLSLL